MRIFVDENIPSRTVEQLRGLGHDVLDIRGTADQGMDDDVLGARLLNERRLLVTTDKGFARHRQEVHHGIMIVRLRQFLDAVFASLLWRTPWSILRP